MTVAQNSKRAEEEPAAGFVFVSGLAGERRRVVPERELVDGDAALHVDIYYLREVPALGIDEILVCDRLVCEHHMKVHEAVFD